MIKLKLSTGGEIRRISFPVRPTWPEFGNKISDLTGVPPRDVAVSYDDGDDVITMSTQAELDDYFENCYRDSAKLTVINKPRSYGRSASTFYDDIDDDMEHLDDIPTIGQTMVIQMEDGGYHMLPRIPEVDEDALSQRFVEINSDHGSQKLAQNSVQASPSLAARNVRQKDMSTPRGIGSKSTSSASIVENDHPTKSDVHIHRYSEAPDISESDRDYVSREGPSNERMMGSFDTVYPIAPPPDAIRPVPNAGQYPAYHTETARSISAHSPSATPRHMPPLDLENANPIETAGSRTPTMQHAPLRPSFVNDVGKLVEDLGVAFASHPELSEGLRNIVKNSIGGEYWATEHDRAISAAVQNVRAAAQETSSRISSAAQDMSRSAERDTVRIIAEALGGVFRVISELSSAPDSHADATRSDNRDNYRQGRSRAHRPRGDRDPGSRRAGHSQYMAPPGQPYPPAWHGPPSLMNKSQSWTPGPWGYGYGCGPVPPGYNYGEPGGYEQEDEHDPDIHETKAELEVLKEEYRAGKERFRKQKEERRRARKELADKRAEGREQIRQNGTLREERIIASMPLQDPSLLREGSSRKPYADVYTPIADDALRSSTSSRPPIAVPPPRSRNSEAGVTPLMHPSELVPPPPPPPPAPMQNSYSAQAPYASSTLQDAPAMARAASDMGPTSWPLPPNRGQTSRPHLAHMRDRIMARLFDMGIQTRPNIIEVVNRYTERNANANEEEVLSSILNAINIRGTPSPRVPDHERRR